MTAAVWSTKSVSRLEDHIFHHMQSYWDMSSDAFNLFSQSSTFLSVLCLLDRLLELVSGTSHFLISCMWYGIISESLCGVTLLAGPTLFLSFPPCVYLTNRTLLYLPTKWLWMYFHAKIRKSCLESSRSRSVSLLSSLRLLGTDEVLDEGARSVEAVLQGARWLTVEYWLFSFDGSIFLREVWYATLTYPLQSVSTWLFWLEQLKNINLIVSKQDVSTAKAWSNNECYDSHLEEQ